jgi:hypothetical protein
MIKNYNVKIRNINVDRVESYCKYLNDGNHKNHTKKDTKIINNSDTNRFLNNVIKSIDNNRKNYELNGKGGKKLKVFGKSLTFNIPTTFTPSSEILKKIERDLIDKIIDLYGNYDYEIDRNELYSVIHSQDNNHIHLIIPQIDKSGNLITSISKNGNKDYRFIKSKTFLNQMKLIWNELVEYHFEVSHNEYKPLSKPQNENNSMIRTLEDLKYSLLKDIDNPKLNERTRKYYKNQVVVIDRILNNSDYQTQDKLDILNKNIDKMNKTRKKERKLNHIRMS